jgi:hypothetical protein
VNATKTEVPCRACGTATDRNISAQVALDFAGRPRAEYAAGVCPACEDLDIDATGSAVRAALRVIGKPEKDWPLATEAFADLPVEQLLYDKATPQRKAWGHVTREQRTELKRAYLAVLDAKVHASADHDRPLPPETPPDDVPAGCLACGRPTSTQWYSVRTRMLTRGPDYVDGVVCAETCAPVLERVGGVGQTFVEHAAQAVLDAPTPVQGVKPWAATGLPPQDTPFGWVTLAADEGDLDLSDLTALQVAVRSLAAKLADLERRLVE